MASWLPGGKGGGDTKSLPSKPKKRERWLVTRKTWRYMADAGKLLIPEALRKGKDYKDFTEDDLRLLEEHYHDVCEKENEFVIWEGPVEDPRVLLAKNRKAPSQSSDQADSLEHSEDSLDYRFESHTAKFRIVLPTGDKPPPGYVQDADWSFSDSSPLDSGILSPSGDFLLSPRDHSPSSDDEYKRDLPARESGIGSGLDTISFSTKRNICIQTDHLPLEFFELQAKEDARLKVESQDEDDKIAQETTALAKRESRRTSEDYDPATMGETVMRYLKMVRRNSKSVDQKKAERFRSMNYDPTLRNIKSKNINLPNEVLSLKHEYAQCEESFIRLLKLCQTPVEPPIPTLPKPKRKFSLSPSQTDRVFSPLSPRYSISIADESIPPELERDFFTHLYTGETAALDAAAVPEDYYTYLEGWYRSQVKGPVAAAKTGSIPSLNPVGSVPTAFPFSLVAPPTTVPTATSQGGSVSTVAGQVSSPGLYIPVSTLQSLRSSLPGQLQHIGSGGSSTLPLQGISRSSNSLTSAQPPPSSSLSFISSVISRGGRTTSNTSPGVRAPPPSSQGPRTPGHTSAGKIISKKLFRTRSKSSNRASSIPIPSPWIPQDDCSWKHVTGQQVFLQDSTLLHLLEIERIFLQKLAQSGLAACDLGTIIRIPKDMKERNEVSKTRKRANLLKKKVLSAGNLGPKPDKDLKKGGDGAVFGIPINQCVELSRKKSTTDIPPDEILSPTSKSSRSDSRTSFGSIFDALQKEKLQDRSTGSLESLNLDIRRSSYAADSQSGLDTLSYTSCDRLLEGPSEIPDRINPQPNIPSVVNTCIKYLELHGLHTVGIFRVGTSKKRVRQLREDFDSGADVIIAEDVSAHDVATILKEFFRDLPEPLLPREIYHPLLAVQKIRNRKQQIEAMKKIIQLLPQVNRDTLYVLLNFLHLVAENSEDRRGPQGEEIAGNKMDSNNLATLFAPNILHSMKNTDGAVSPENPAKAAERTETINIVRSLIDYNRELFELTSEELHELYLKMNEEVPEAMDYQLRRRAIINGDEYVDLFDGHLIYDMPEPRLLGPNDPHIAEHNDRLRRKEEERGRARRRGSEETQEKGGSWFRFREKSDSSESGETKWFNKKRDKSQSTSSMRTPSSESVIMPPARGSQCDKQGIVTGTLKINVTGLQGQGGQAGQSDPGGQEPCEEEERRQKGVLGKRVVLRRLSHDGEGKVLSCEIHIPTIRSAGSQNTDSIVYSSRGVSPSDPVFFGSGSSTPSNPMSPGLVSLEPAVFSGPPSPMSVTPTPEKRNLTRAEVEVETHYLDSRGRGQGQDVSLVLKPVPIRNKPSPADSVQTLVNEPIPDIQVSSADRGHSPNPLGLRRLKDENLASSSLSLPPESNGSRPSVLSAFSYDMRSKTDNLDRLINEVERSSADNLTAGSGREVKKYIRRRYTDSRHPTTELPDVRGDPLPSVQDPPLRKSRSKQNLGSSSQIPTDEPDAAVSVAVAGQVTERASYKRWQKTSSRYLDTD